MTCLKLTIDREFVRKYCAQTDREVHDATVDNWSQDTGWQLCNDFSEEISTHRVHVVINFSQEYGSLIWEDQDDILD